MLHEIDLTRTDLNLLVLFEAVQQERHVGRAAERLNLSPSAVSHGLGRLRRLLNDPLFLRTPKGVVPTARAQELAEPIADILARMRSVVATAEPFDPATSKRRFVIGAPDGVSAVFLPPLLASLRTQAPGIDIGLRQLLPSQGGREIQRAWDPALTELESGAMDIAVLPVEELPKRFAERMLYLDDFVIAMRRGHKLAGGLTLKRFCAAEHVLVSLTADVYGFIDAALAERGVSRRVAVTVPNFMMALSLIAETDFIGALPRRFFGVQGPLFGVVSAEAPLALPRFRIRAVVPKVALMDDGLAWLYRLLAEAVRELPTAKAKRPRRDR